MILSEKLKDLRKQRGLSQLELSEKLFVSRPGSVRLRGRNVEAINGRSAVFEQAVRRVYRIST